MIDTAAQARIAQNCTNAAFGYARAAAAAYSALAVQTIDFWQRAQVRGAGAWDDAECSAARSWPSSDTMPSPFAIWGTPASAFFAFRGPWETATSPLAQQIMLAPATVWWDLITGRGASHCWPAAFAMMTAGVPSSVAWPTAEANAAALEAAEAATEEINNAFASYRSESGYAVIQIVPPKKLMAALLVAPFGVPLLPWVFPWPGA